MADWYYESNGDREGPISEERIKELISAGILNARSLVWNNEFGSSWRPLAETSLASEMSPLAINEPPPLPTRAPLASEVSRSESPKFDQQSTHAEAEAFLGSNLARKLIGKNADYYLEKWRSFALADGFDLNIVAKQRSWNWSAFFAPYGWLVYRKMYKLAALVIACILVSQFFGPLAYVVGFGVGIAAAVYGNAWYFNAVHQKWLKLRTVQDTLVLERAVLDQGGTNLPWALGVPIALIVVSAVLSSNGGLFASQLSCSSSATQELVTQIAREQIPKDAYMMFIVDEKKTKISLDVIRTQKNDGTGVSCAASIVYALSFKGQGGEQVRAALEKVLNRDITYRVEKTDQGGQIYATVYGLNN